MLEAYAVQERQFKQQRSETVNPVIGIAVIFNVANKHRCVAVVDCIGFGQAVLLLLLLPSASLQLNI